MDLGVQRARNSEGDIVDTNSVISLINASKTLIQNGEISCLFFQQFPTHPDEKGRRLREIVAFREQELQNADEEGDRTFRQNILRNLEKEKKYEPFRDSTEYFQFVEIFLIFQMRPDYAITGNSIDSVMSCIDRYENFPSLGHRRYFINGYEYLFLNNATEQITVSRGSQFSNTENYAGVERKYEEEKIDEVGYIAGIPPTRFILENEANVEATEFSGEKGFIISYYPRIDDKSVLTKVFVRSLPSPQVFREEYYYKSESPNANGEGYWLTVRYKYSDFQMVNDLNFAVPKVRLIEEFDSDGWLRRRNIYVLKEMNFNIGFPEGFFDLHVNDFDNDKGTRKNFIEIGKSK